MWRFRRRGVYQKYNYYRRYRPWYGYPYRRNCFFNRRLTYYPWYLRPWSILMFIISFIILIILI